MEAAGQVVRFALARMTGNYTRLFKETWQLNGIVDALRHGEYLVNADNDKNVKVKDNDSPTSAQRQGEIELGYLAAYAPGGIETASVSLTDWHEALRHPHAACVMFLEQQYLIKITREKTIDDFNCRICKEAKSTLPHYQRGTRSIKGPGERENRNPPLCQKEGWCWCLEGSHCQIW